MIVASLIRTAYKVFRGQQHRLAGKPVELRRLFSRATRRLPMSDAVTVEIGNIDHMLAEWVRPKSRDSLEGVILYCHGGGYVVGNISTHRALVAQMALASRCDGLLFNYRLAPEDPFPAGLDDALKAYMFLLETYRPDQVVFAGDSAGGGMALALMIRLRDEGKPLPAGAVLFSPWTDLACSGDSIHTREHLEVVIDPTFIPLWAGWYAGNEALDHPLISPVFADYHGLPPFLVHVGTDEVLYDDATRVVERAQAAGVKAELEVWEGMFHVWQFYYAWMGDARRSVKKAGAYIRRLQVGGQEH